MGLKRRREIQRTIDRLQPGKSKGNLLSKENHQNHVDGSGVESKSQSNENDENTPKISLGKVLPSDILSFGIGEAAKKESEDDCVEEKIVSAEHDEPKEEKVKDDTEVTEPKTEEIETEKKPAEPPAEPKKEKPTPNLSAWFKAFGAPKAQPPPKKKPEVDENKIKEDEVEEDKRINVVGIQSPARRQRKTSTGSSVSERSSFSIEPGDGNSPRIHDEPYVSPQQDMKTYHHSPINGTIKVGFYQDTCFPRGTSEKSSSPRDFTGCSPRDLPSVSPRNATFSPRDYPNASPRSPYCSPRHPSMSPGPREYIGSPRELPPNASPRDYPSSPLMPHPHEYSNASPRTCSSPKEPVPLSPYASPHPSHSAPIYSHYPPHLATYYDSNKILELRNNEKAPMSSYPVKKRVYNEIDNSVSKANDTPAYKSGGSFTPTREAMEQERTFTPTPGRMPGPGPSQSLRVSSPLTMPIPHSLHYDPYAEERRMASPFYAGGSSPHPIYPQPTGVLPANYRRDPNIRDEREMTQSYPPSRSNTPSYPSSPQSEIQRSKSPIIGYSSRPSTPALNTSPSSTPINYSNVNTEASNTERSPSPKIVNRGDGLHNSPTHSYSNSSELSDLSIKKVNPPSSPISYPGSRFTDVLSKKVASPYNRTMSEIPHGLNYSGQDLSKLSVPLSYSNQSELLSGKMNYNHPMADLMQTSARYNYQMSELMQGKAPPVYNHPMQDFIQGKAAAAYSNMNLANYANRPITEIMQSKINDIQAREMAYSPRTVPTSRPEPPPTKPAKKSRKKKAETPSSGFHQYVAPTSEPISLKSNSSVVPGSAFNFGPPLKESYGQYLDEIRSSYFVAHPEGSAAKGNPHTPPYFLGHASSRTPPTYPHPFMNAQYQQYLQRHPEELLRPMVLHQSLLPHTPGYPHGYLGMHDAMNRPSWL